MKSVASQVQLGYRMFDLYGQDGQLCVLIQMLLGLQYPPMDRCPSNHIRYALVVELLRFGETHDGR